MGSPDDARVPDSRSPAGDPGVTRGRSGVVRVGRWRFDRSLNTLACGDELVRVEPKVADLLSAFVQRPGDLLSRSELLDAVWPGVVVGDEALSQSINKLRRALGDSTRAAAYLQTVPKRGYRLIAEVACDSAGNVAHLDTRDAGGVPATGLPAESAGGPTQAVGSDASMTPRARGWSARRWRISALAVAVAVVAAVVIATLAVPGLVGRGRPGDDDLSAILARDAAVSGAQRTIPDVLVRPFDVIGPEGTAITMARAFRMQVVATIAQSSQLRVIARDGASVASESAPVSPLLYQVDGTVQQSGDRLVVHLVLSNTVSHLVLWSRKFDLPLGDLSAGQQAATAELLQALAVKLTESERSRLARPYTSSTSAYQHFLLGQAAFATRERRSNGDARDHYRRALAEDPSFARAQAGLALTYAADATFGWSPDRQTAIALAMDNAGRALALDPEQADVHWVLAWVELQGRHHAAALGHARRAIELDASYADAYALAATVASYIGRPGDALALMRTAARLKSSPGFLYHLVLGRAYFFLGDDEQAIASLGVSLRLNPGFLESRIYLAAALARLGRRENAAWEAEEIRAQAPGFSAREWIGESLLTDRAEIGQLEAALAPLGLDLSGPGAVGGDTRR
jgi:DNA-binding winged helix-turn-helix (wHTH) protein/TolB-like protein